MELELRRNRKGKKPSAESSSSSLVKGNKKDFVMYFAVTYNNACVDETNPFECYDWYALNPNVSPTEQYSTLSPITRMFTPVHHGNISPERISSISLDSKIYVFKSYSTSDYAKTYLSVFDVTTGDWVDVLLPKKLKMISPKLVTCGGMIYILEENLARRSNPNVWGEAFDPATNSLTPLPKPPGLYNDDDYEIDCSAVIDDTRFFVRFKFKNEMLVFDINLWSWSSVEVPYVRCGGQLKMVVSSGFVYLFFGLEIFVYDPSQGGGICDKVQGLVLPSSVGGVSCPFFPFVRGKHQFYLIWSPWGHSKASEGSVIHSLKFKIDRVTDYRGRQAWQATVDCCDSYHVQGSGVCDCVAIEGNKKWNMERCGGVKIAP